MADLHYPWSTDVEGLESGTTYEFRVVSGEDASEWHSFTTADTSDRLDFLYFGDAQQGLTEEWAENSRMAFENHPDSGLVLHAGDMIDVPYNHAEWNDWFGALGDDATSRQHLLTPGNHEYYTPGNFWDLPQVPPTDYYQNYTLPTNGLYDERNYYVDRNDVRIVVLDGNQQIDEQATWLDETLANNPNAWTVVMFHQPVYNTLSLIHI